VSVKDLKRADYGMDGDRPHLELFVEAWVEAIEDGKEMPQEGGGLIPEEEWNWVKSEVTRRIKKPSRKDTA
jgi:hypothetical protein